MVCNFSFVGGLRRDASSFFANTLGPMLTTLAPTIGLFVGGLGIGQAKQHLGRDRRKSRVTASGRGKCLYSFPCGRAAAGAGAFFAVTLGIMPTTLNVHCQGTGTVATHSHESGESGLTLRWTAHGRDVRRFCIYRLHGASLLTWSAHVLVNAALAAQLLHPLCNAVGRLESTPALPPSGFGSGGGRRQLA